MTHTPPGDRRGKGWFRIIPASKLLAEKLALVGGISQEEAISAAVDNVESLRDVFAGALSGEIDTLEFILNARDGLTTAETRLNALLRQADMILTITGTYQFTLLDAVVKKFCDLCSLMPLEGLDDIEPLMVHIRAMRLLAPGSPLATDERTGSEIASELQKIHHHVLAKLGEPSCLPLPP